MPSTRNFAMGGPHVAYTNDMNSLFINPAVFGTVRQINIAELSLGVYGDYLGMIDILESHNDPAKLAGTFSRFIRNSQGTIPMGFNLRGPIGFGGIKNGWGWGVFERVYGGTKITGSTMQAWAGADLTFNLGHSFRVLKAGTHTLDVGVLGKFFSRMEVNSGVISITDLISGGDILIDRFNYVPTTLGAGLDLGIQYRPVNALTLGLTVHDLFSLGYVGYSDLHLNPTIGSVPPGYIGYIKPVVNLGVSYKIFNNPFISWTVMADYRDALNLLRQRDYNSRNGWLNLSVGTELILFKHIAFRAGLHDMLPSVGMGLDLFIFKLDAAFYGKELSNEPGRLSTYAMDVGLLFRY
ncbi:MAG: hypothetical protein LBL43_05760 [Treponema sp.]|nr:hypothetical protein [Treponema sp.]